MTLVFLVTALGACGETGNIDLKPAPVADAGPDARPVDAAPTEPPGGWPKPAPGGLTVPPPPGGWPIPFPSMPEVPTRDSMRPIADCRPNPFAAPSPDRCPPAVWDKFDQNTADWGYFDMCIEEPGCTGQYMLSARTGMAVLEGDAYRKRVGMERIFPVYPEAPFWLRFRWRQTSRNQGFLGPTTENLTLQVFDPAGALLHEETLSAPILATGTCWQTFARDLTVAVKGQSRVTIRLSMLDLWTQNFSQVLFVDDVMMQSCLGEMRPGSPF